MKKEELLLLTISAAGSEGLSPVQLQKSLFLIGESGLNGLPTDFYQFVPYNYGPFDADVYCDADELTADGMIEQDLVTGRRWAMYRLTKAGEERASKLYTSQQPQVLLAYIKEVVQWVLGLSFSELLRAIYAKYPEYRVNSVFQE